MSVRYKQFRIGDVFNIERTHKALNAQDLKIAETTGIGFHPYVVRQSRNNGIKGYIAVENQDWLNPGNTISFAQDTAELFYQSEPYYTGNNMRVMTIKNHTMTENIALFLIAALRKTFANYSWGMSFRKEVLDSEHVSLPVKAKVVPDWSKLDALLSSCRVGGYVDMSKIDTSSWKEFKLGDILRKIDVNKLPYRISDLPKAPTDGYTLPAISSGGSNQGITCYVPEQGATILQNVISIASNGDGYAFWQPDKFTIIQDAYAVERADGEPFTENVALFLVAGIQKILNQSFSWTNKSGWNKVKECSLTLPYKTQDVPDWDYMQERIAELEQERIAELEQYLMTTGLNDYELTDEDKEVLSINKSMKEFVMHSVFERLKAGYQGEGRRQDNVSKVFTNEFSLPLINCKYGDNGIMYYGRPEEFTHYKNVLSIIYNGPPTEGQTYFQDSIGVFTDAYLVSVKKELLSSISKEIGLYLTCAINKSIHNEEHKRYSRGNKAMWDNRVENDLVSLPVQTDASGTPIIDSTHKYHEEGYLPDFEYMEKYIRAIEKLVIKDVVCFKDIMIKKTKELCKAQKGDTDGEAA